MKKMSIYFRKWCTKTLNFLRNLKGVAIIEFVLVAPVFFLLIFATIDFGIRFTTMNLVEYGMSYGIRQMRIAGSSAGTAPVRAVFNTNQVLTAFKLPTLSINFDLMQLIQISYTYQPILSILSPKTITIYNGFDYEPS